MSRRLRRIFWACMTGIILTVVIVLGVGAYLLKADPSWYRKHIMTDAQQAAAERRLLDRLATLRNDVGRVQAATRQSGSATHPADWPSFDLELTEDEVNGPLARWTTGGPITQWAAENPDAKSVLDQIQEPHVRFLDGKIELAGRSLSLGSLVSIELVVDQPEDPTKPPTVTLGRPWAGRMPLSRSTIEDPTIKGIETLRKTPETKVPRSVIDASEELVRGEPTTPIVLLSSSTAGAGWLPARVEHLEVTDGKLHVTLRPFDEKAPKASVTDATKEAAKVAADGPAGQKTP